MASIGLVMIIGVSGANQSHGNYTGIAFGLVAASFYAAVILLNKHIKSVTDIDRALILKFHFHHKDPYPDKIFQHILGKCCG